MSGVEPLLLEAGCFIASTAIKSYLDHRNKLINENREDELLTSQIKKFIYNRMDCESDVDNIPPEVSTIYPEEKSDDDEGDTKTITQLVLDSLPPMKRINKRRSVLGFNPQKIKDFVVDTARSLTPQKQRIVETPPEFDKFVRKVLVFIRNEMIIQDDTDCTLLQQRHYTAKLMRSLCIQDKNER